MARIYRLAGQKISQLFYIALGTTLLYGPNPQRGTLPHFYADRQGRIQSGVAGLHPPPPHLPQTRNVKKNIFCRYYIKMFTLFPIQPKSATEFGWWQVAYINFEK
jgi:hypothetical protein